MARGGGVCADEEGSGQDRNSETPARQVSPKQITAYHDENIAQQRDARISQMPSIGANLTTSRGIERVKTTPSDQQNN